MQVQFYILFLIFGLVSFALSVRIGSFNLHQYGSKKAADANITNTVAKIISDFDLAIIQEISDVTLQAPQVLLKALNTISSANPYTMSLSDRVGDSTTKEQYIFFNRESTSGVQLVSAYVYNDSVYDLFERAPYVGTFKVVNSGGSGISMFTIMDVHLRPDSAYQETINLRSVIEDFIIRNPQYFSETDTSYSQALAQNVENATVGNKPSLKTNHPILIIGDFNADCTYLSAKRLGLLQTVYFPDFAWMINSPVKTNTRQSCTYDRVLINGANFVNAVVPKSNTSVIFADMFGMNMNDSLLISDHVPVKFDINW